jgi:uncharacterized metal-binding protein
LIEKDERKEEAEMGPFKTSSWISDRKFLRKTYLKNIRFICKKLSQQIYGISEGRRSEITWNYKIMKRSLRGRKRRS